MSAQHSWEQFLTDRDKAHLAKTWQKTEDFGLGSTPALLVIDVYYKLVGIEREPLLESVEKWPMSCGLEGWDAIDRISELLDLCREASIPVIFTRDTPGPMGWAGRRSKVPRVGGGGVPDRLPEAWRARANEIVDEVAPHAGEPVLEKCSPSAFFGTALQPYLNQRKVDTVLVCGATTSGCVRATVSDSTALRYRVGVVAECCFDRTEMSHHSNLFDMHQKSADILTVADVKDYLGRL